VEPDELPHETAIREILEETGVLVEIISEPYPKTDHPDAFFLPTPVYLQSVLAVEKGQRFYHVDLAYLCRPVAQTVIEPGMPPVLPKLKASPEVKESRWVCLKDLSQLTLARNVKEALDHLAPKLSFLGR
jgi:8-oxo-dGTP pyrophosphatase MutT (NUDIX family)